MNAEELFNEVKTDTSENIIKQLKRLFFSRKIKEVVTDKDITTINYEESRKKLKAFVANFKQELPEAELIYYMKDFPQWIKMENVDFEFDACGMRFYDRTISLTGFSATDNIADLLREFNRIMPLWESEFCGFYTENQYRIDELEKKRLISSSSKQTVVKEYLKRKAYAVAITNRRLLPYMNDSVVDALIKDKKGLHNYKFSFNCDGDMRLDFNFGGCCWIGLCSPEVLHEIDRRIPQWIEEGKELEREFDKREKIKQINENSTKMLVKNKMRELGCEYRFADKDKGQSYYYKQSEKPKEYELTIKLQKGRKLVVTIPSDNFDRVRKILDSLEASINAINSVPMNHRIKSQSVGNEAWLKE